TSPSLVVGKVASKFETSSPSGPVVQNAESSSCSAGTGCSVVSVSGLTVSFAKAAVSIAPGSPRPDRDSRFSERLGIRGQNGRSSKARTASKRRRERPPSSGLDRHSAQKTAYGREVRPGLLNEAHMAYIGDDDQLAVGDSLVQDARRSRCRRAVLLADDHERRLVNVLQLGTVVEGAVTHACEVAKHRRRADGFLGVARRRLPVEVEGHLVAKQLLELLFGLDRLLVLPGGGDRFPVLAERVKRRLDVCSKRFAGVATGGDDVGGGGAELSCVIRRDDRAERVTEQREAVELERLGEQVDVPGEDLERQGFRIDAVGAALAALVNVKQAKVVAQRVEVRPEHRVVQTRPAVENDQRKAIAVLHHKQPVTIWEVDFHLPLSLLR